MQSLLRGAIVVLLAWLVGLSTPLHGATVIGVNILQGAHSPGLDNCKALSPKTRQEGQQLLAGAGDLELVMKKLEFDQEARFTAPNSPPRLIINGVNLEDSAALIATFVCDSHVYLRFRIAPKKGSEKLWSAIYNSSGLTGKEPLVPAIGWDGGGSPITLDASAGDRREISVSTELRVLIAFAIVALVLLLTYAVYAYTDAFRDAKTPWWFTDAMKLRTLKVDGAWLALQYSNFDATRLTTYYANAAQLAVQEKYPKTQLEEWDYFFGLVLSQRTVERPRATYSLARTQLGLWFVFSVCSGVFLWIVYGDLPRIENSLLALLGISVGTAGVSLTIDTNISKDVNGFKPSQGFYDLVTGFDDQQQVYRYQAVVINVLLLTVGVMNVIQSLTYPIFDPTWLAFLGISGVALATGKQIIETKPTTT